MTLVAALAGLAGAVADLRQAQQRLLQATAARHAAARLAAVTAGAGPGQASGTICGPGSTAAAPASSVRPHRAAARVRRPTGGRGGSAPGPGRSP
jgi:hypothetical protein